MSIHRPTEENTVGNTASVHFRDHMIATARAAQAVLALPETIKDPIDRRIVRAAATFLEFPTHNLQEIKDHASAVAEVLGGYLQMGDEAPNEVHAIDHQLLLHLCWHHIDSVKIALEEVPLDKRLIQKLMALALDSAKILVTGNKDASAFAEVKELERWIEEIYKTEDAPSI